MMAIMITAVIAGVVWTLITGGVAHWIPIVLAIIVCGGISKRHN